MASQQYLKLREQPREFEVEHMEHMFNQATSFDQSLSSWDCRSVVFYDGILFGATAFQQDLPEGWDANVAFGEGHHW